jgi:hypothetical protein
MRGGAAMLSPRSRGKGNRRCPVPTSRGKRKPAEWRKQAVHAVEAFPKNSGELVQIRYDGPYGRSPAEWIYLFDQRIAGTGICYHAELDRSRFQPAFNIHVPESDADKVSAIIAQITKR